MEAIKDIINTVVAGWQTKRKGVFYDNPRALLKKIFSKKDLSHVQFHYFSKGTLSLKVDSSTRLYYLSLQKEDLLAKLRKKSKATIKDIRFYLGET